MALQSSGAISANDINVELTYTGTATITLNDTAARTLAGVASGQISFSDFYGKSFVITDTNFAYTEFVLHFDGANGAETTYIKDSIDSAQFTAGGTNFLGFSSHSPYAYSGALPYARSKSGSLYLGISGTYGDRTNPISNAYQYRGTTFTGGSDFTIEGWVKPDIGYLYGGIGYTTPFISFQNVSVVPNNNTSSNPYIRIGQATNGYLYATWSTNGGANAGSIAAEGNMVEAGTWAHFALVRYSGTMYFYVNGKLIGTGATTYVPSTTQYFSIGIGTNESYCGYLSDIRVTQAAVYTAEFTVPSSALSSSAGGTTALHLINADKFGAITNNPTTKNVTFAPSLGSGNGNTLSTSQYKFGTSSWFNAANQSYGSGLFVYDIDANSYNGTIFNGNIFTIEGWFYRTTTSNTQYLFKQIVAYGAGQGIEVYTSGNFVYAIVNGTTISASTANFPINTWTHIAVSKSGANFYLFVAGTLIASSSSVSSTTWYTEGAYRGICIGNSQYNGVGTAFVGYIDEFRYTKNLCRYTTSFTVPSTNFGDKPTTVAAQGQLYWPAYWDTYSTRNLDYTYSFMVPPNVTSVSAVVVGSGGVRAGGGGGLAYGTFSVSAGEVLKIKIGRQGEPLQNASSGTPSTESYIQRWDGTYLLRGYAGSNGSGASGGAGGSYYVNTAVVTSYGGASGGAGGGGWNTTATPPIGGSGGGAAGYTGNGGAGGAGCTGVLHDTGLNGSSGSGGGGGGGGGGGVIITNDPCGDFNNYWNGGNGGAVSLFGQGTSGAGGSGGVANTSFATDGSTGSGLAYSKGLGTYSAPNSYMYHTYVGAGISGGTYQENTGYDEFCNPNGPSNYYTATPSSQYLGGASGSGAVRIIWGSGRSYPSTNTADVSPS